jgi:cysteine-S-conjugate beta-lyase
MIDEFDELSLDALRNRQSAKWAKYPDDVLPAWVAEMDFPLAPPVRDALLAAVERDDFGYTHAAGLAEAFAAFAFTRFGWRVEPERVWVVPDVMVGAAEVLRLVTRPGDGVVINPPVYPPFFATIDEIERRIVEAPLAETSNGWELDLKAIDQAFAAGARTYLLCNPHNPTGRVFDRAALEQVVELAERYDAFVVADEIHGPLTLPGAVHTPFISLGEAAAARSVTVTAATKAWNFPGLKCGLVVAGSAKVAGELSRLPKEIRERAGHLGALASEAAFRDGGEWLDALLSYLDRNRQHLRELLTTHLPRVRYVMPEASYLAWLDCRSLPFGDDPAAVFLERGRVALLPGPDFGREGRGFARLNIGTSCALVEEAVRRMGRAMRA